MPCYKCSNGKYKYGIRGNCVFDTLDECRAAEAAIHAQENKPSKADKELGDAYAGTTRPRSVSRKTS